MDPKQAHEVRKLAKILAEEGDGWATDEPSRLGRYARRLWGGLLAHERVRDQ